ncbi:MAG: dipicolinate synthase [Clostridia bacterium]|nr:dipicolinate synthase [Clostridia bacterium]
MEIKLAILGGDRRQSSLAVKMSEYGVAVSVFGTDTAGLSGAQRVTVCEDLHSCLAGADSIILPLPASGDGELVSCPMSGERISLYEVFNFANGRPVFGGRFSPAVKRLAERTEARLIDYFDSEELKIRNSVLASEGAVSVAMNELDVALFGSKCLVTGYGRLAKTLAPMLRALGAEVTVAARKNLDLAWASAYGFGAMKLGLKKNGESTLTDLAPDIDVIFNTVPSWIFDRAVLEAVSPRTLIVDLASAPGGVDPKAASELGRRVVPALSLPGKYAPVSAGRLLGEHIVELLKQEGLM